MKDVSLASPLLNPKRARKKGLIALCLMAVIAGSVVGYGLIMREFFYKGHIAVSSAPIIMARGSDLLPSQFVADYNTSTYSISLNCTYDTITTYSNASRIINLTPTPYVVTLHVLDSSFYANEWAIANMTVGSEGSHWLDLTQPSNLTITLPANDFVTVGFILAPLTSAPSDSFFTVALTY